MHGGVLHLIMNAAAFFKSWVPPWKRSLSGAGMALIFVASAVGGSALSFLVTSETSRRRVRGHQRFARLPGGSRFSLSQNPAAEVRPADDLCRFPRGRDGTGRPPRHRQWRPRRPDCSRARRLAGCWFAHSPHSRWPDSSRRRSNGLYRLSVGLVIAAAMTIVRLLRPG